MSDGGLVDPALQGDVERVQEASRDAAEGVVRATLRGLSAASGPLRGLGEEGGADRVARAIATIASVNMSVAFSFWSHRMVLTYVQEAESGAFAARWLGVLRDLDVTGSTALAASMAARATGAALPIAASPYPGGLTLTGSIAWASNLFAPDFLLVTAAEIPGEGRRIIALRAGDPGVEVAPFPVLVDLQDTASSSVRLSRVQLPADRILAVDFDQFIARVRPRFLLWQASFCCGLSARALAESASLVRSGVGEVFAREHADLRATLDRLEAEIVERLGADENRAPALRCLRPRARARHRALAPERCAARRTGDPARSQGDGGAGFSGAKPDGAAAPRGRVLAHPGSHGRTAPMGTRAFELRGGEKRYGRGDAPVFTSVDLDLRHGEILVLLGPSGCGKSTLLRCIAGLETLSGGTLRYGDGGGPGGAHSAFVFQDPLLMPWLDVRQNAALGFRYGRNRALARPGYVERVLDELDLGNLAARMPHQLSGGQAQRVSLARAVLTAPQLLLLDEPFAALDVLTRARLQEWVLTLRERYGFGAVFVTHDVAEAVRIADRIALLSPPPATIGATWDLGGTNRLDDADLCAAIRAQFAVQSLPEGAESAPEPRAALAAGI